MDQMDYIRTTEDDCPGDCTQHTTCHYDRLLRVEQKLDHINTQLEQFSEAFSGSVSRIVDEMAEGGIGGMIKGLLGR